MAYRPFHNRPFRDSRMSLLRVLCGRAASVNTEAQALTVGGDCDMRKRCKQINDVSNFVVDTPGLHFSGQRIMNGVRIDASIAVK
jgi:hypothetical protein